MNEKIRLDLFIAQKYEITRSKAQALIENESCIVNGLVQKKASAQVSENDVVELLAASASYVSRGGFKLEKALDIFKLEVNGMICADVGSSTGGFTDLMLQKGAKLVYAIDSGSDQMDAALREDKRVCLMENTNIREVTKLPHEIDFLAADVSFVSLTKIIANIKLLMKPGASAVLLVKPQFEAGKGKVGNGVVKDRTVHLSSLAGVMKCAEENGFIIKGLSFSPLEGQSGNIEYLLWIAEDGTSKVINIKNLVDEAFSALKDKRN